jgi:hypothetical protein
VQSTGVGTTDFRGVSFQPLVDAMDMLDLAFESLVLRHPELFSAGAAARSAERLRGWTKARECVPV